MDELLKNRFLELANRSYNNNIYTFTDFLGLMEISTFHEMERECAFAGYTIYGGAEETERKVIRFGKPEALGYEEEFPIRALRIEPLMAKFSDELGHRDFLGSLMNLGIERSTLGDIFVEGNVAYLFCLDTISEYIMDNLTRIKHTSVRVSVVENPEELPPVKTEEMAVAVSTPRIDAVISRVYSLSRSESLELIQGERVFLNGRVCTDPGKNVDTGDAVSVRGYGRFRVREKGGTSRKGKQYINIERNV